MTAGAGFALRRLTGADAEAFRAVRLEGLERHPTDFGAVWEDETSWPIAFFADRLDQNWVLGGFAGDALAGVVGLMVSDRPKLRHKGTLWGMHVLASARGRGLGRALVNGLLAHAALSTEGVVLSVTSTNTAAARLYASAGFTVYRLETRALRVGDAYFDTLLMVRWFH